MLYLQILFGEFLEFAYDGSECSIDFIIDQLVLITGQVLMKLSERSLGDWE